MIDLESWVRSRLEGAPESLRSRVLAALAQAGLRTESTAPAGSSGEPAVALASALKRAGDRLLEEAKAGPPTRETALALLAADALVTLACELLAEQAPERLENPFF